MAELWEEIWLELREALMNQPPCPNHPEYPCVRTLGQKVINDIVRVVIDGIVVRSHRQTAALLIGQELPGSGPFGRVLVWLNIAEVLTVLSQNRDEPGTALRGFTRRCGL